MRILALLSLVLATGACSRLPETLRPYADAAPQELVTQIDKRIYSPVAAGLEKMEADLQVDVSGFFPEELRPKKPVHLPVHFAWKNGRAQFGIPDLPAPIRPLEARLFTMLQGTEEDIVYRSFGERLAGMHLSVAPTPNGLLQLIARDEQRALTWRITVDEHLLVPHLTISMPGGRTIESHLFYTEDSRLKRIESVQVIDGQRNETVVEIENYRETDGFWLPQALTYTGGVGKVRFPPLSIRLKNVNIGGN